MKDERAEASAWRVAALCMMNPEELRTVLHADGPKSLPWIRAAAEYGVVEAQIQLGRMLLEGSCVDKNEASAACSFLRAAVTGSADAENMLGRCYEHGWGVPKNSFRAADWFTRAACKEEPWAQYNLGHLYLSGHGVSRDPARAFAWYCRAATHGHARAMNLVGRCYEHGYGTEADFLAARSWYRKSAHAGYFRGAFNFATILAQEGCRYCSEFWLRKALGSAPPSTRHGMQQVWVRLVCHAGMS